ncbi:MAG: DNA topoisomerase IB [Aeromicrobium sp.]|uniref:DNA topoisomerase IB n=1 Tax=Aeromicrobium sp. TaxID=1871063 RepID=UPI003C3B1650
MVRLRRVNSAMPGWRRLRRGRGFSYLDDTGEPLAELDVVRVKDLVIPPAWSDVWICPLPNGHLQAVGTDVAGRRQYLYHPDWRVKRDLEKYEHMEQFARALIRHRTTVRRDLGGDSLDRTRVCAAVFGLLDLGMFRVGSDRYADENGSHGLTTLERSHVTAVPRGIDFDYPAKSGQIVQVTVRDQRVVEVLAALKRRRSGGDRLIAFKEGGRWRGLGAEDVNEYVKDSLGGDFTAKNFRTWRANVVAARSLAVAEAVTPTARKRVIAATMREVSEHLGNTPAIARSSYVDPRVVDLFGDGIVVGGTHRRVAPGAPVSRTLERAVLRLLKRG